MKSSKVRPKLIECIHIENNQRLKNLYFFHLK